MSHKAPVALMVVLTLLVGTDYLAAWTAPTTMPPASNVAAPVNVGSSPQAKPGLLGVNELIANTVMVGRSDVPTVDVDVAVAGSIAAAQYCDTNGANCVASSGIGGGTWGAWQNVAGQRAPRAWYQNTGSTARMVNYQFGTGGPADAYISPTGSNTNWVRVTGPDGDSGEWKPGSFIVPPGHYYYIDASAGIRLWTELQLPI